MMRLHAECEGHAAWTRAVCGDRSRPGYPSLVELPGRLCMPSRVYTAHAVPSGLVLMQGTSSAPPRSSGAKRDVTREMRVMTFTLNPGVVHPHAVRTSPQCSLWQGSFATVCCSCCPALPHFGEAPGACCRRLCRDAQGCKKYLCVSRAVRATLQFTSECPL